MEAWFEDRIEEVISVGDTTIPPSQLCLKENQIETISFLADWRDRFTAIQPNTIGPVAWSTPSKKKKGLTRIGGYADFSRIKFISTSVALILTAEYDRLNTLMHSVPPVINLRKWSNEVFVKLYEIGFFENIGHATDINDEVNTSGNIKTMRIISGKNATDIEKVSKCIRELSKYLNINDKVLEKTEIDLNNALSEAMINVAKHAYPVDHDFSKKHVGKWWVTASANRDERQLTIVIYDQGASIPVTFPKKKFSQSVKDFLGNVLIQQPEFEFENDSSYIMGAMQPGKSSSNQKHQGLGLPEMRDVIDHIGDGYLSIHSRGGVCYYDPDNKFDNMSVQHSIGGTLIEWTLRLPTA